MQKLCVPRRLPSKNGARRREAKRDWTHFSATVNGARCGGSTRTGLKISTLLRALCGSLCPRELLRPRRVEPKGDRRGSTLPLGLYDIDDCLRAVRRSPFCNRDRGVKGGECKALRDEKVREADAGLLLCERSTKCSGRGPMFNDRRFEVFVLILSTLRVGS